MVMPGLPERMMDSFPTEGLLCEEEEPLEQIPTAQKHMPSEKWIAGRLRIPHEFWWRITPGVARKMARAKVKAEGGAPGEEIWVHKRPDDEIIKEYSLKVRGRVVGCGGKCGGCGSGTDSKSGPQSVPKNYGSNDNQSKHDSTTEGDFSKQGTINEDHEG